MHAHRSLPTRRSLRVALVAIVATATIATVLAVSPTAVAAAPTCAGSSTLESAERRAEDRFVTNLNGLRRARGLGVLAVNPSIADAADQWSVSMAANGGISHDPSYFSLLQRVVDSLLRGAENVGFASMQSWCTATELLDDVDRRVDLLHVAFVNSPSHYANMVGSYNQVGVGVELRNGRLWVTVRFARGDLPVVVSESTRRYVDAVHRLFLGRPATVSDQTRWGPRAQSGNLRNVTDALAVSDEWAGVRIADLYRSILGRTPDRSGRQFWLSKVASGTRLEQVAAGFYASEEYFGHRGRTNRGFVAGLYRDILERTPDAGGLAAWSTMLATGRMTRHDVASGFYASIESRRDRVTTLYREILNRGPDPSGLAYWADRVRRLGDVSLASFLASSQEYFHRAQRS